MFLNKKYFTFFACLFMMSCIFEQRMYGDIQVIVNPDVVAGNLSISSLRNIFLGKKSYWENGSKIVPVVLKEGKTHQVFLGKYIHKTPHQFASYWRRMIFTGKGSPPQIVNSEKELLEFVQETFGAIGYISDGDFSLEGVNAIELTDNLSMGEISKYTMNLNL